LNATVKSAVARWINNSRKLLPASLVPMLVRVRTRIALRRLSVRGDAENQMRFVTGDDQPHEVIGRLAEAYVKRSIWRGEARWHPQLVNGQEVEGAELLLALRRQRQGFIVAFTHHGDYEGISPSLAHAGIDNHEVVTSEVWHPDAPIWMKQQVVVLRSRRGANMLDVAHGSAAVRDLLARGEVVAIAIDQPGHTRMRFLGRDLSLSSGAARIAKDMGVPVAVVTAHPDPDRPEMCGKFRVAEVLDPSEFESVGSLLRVMVSRLEEAFLAWPEAAEHPLRMTDRSLVKPPSNRSPHPAQPESGAGEQTA
jgi:lauroyl/myristoyl acyltransferase